MIARADQFVEREAREAGRLEVRARDHGVTATYIKDLTGAGLAMPGADALVRLRDHGVTGAFVKRARSAGYQAASVDELIRLRDRGLLSSR
ncbi:MAG: hypothetical protein KGN76_11425 [Acidobacteriota bacterium]|nr:hypothetical protein [Acidobacteriota bacterium]